MAAVPSGRPSFQITHETSPSERLIAGFSSFGLAGLTAVDFLVDQLGLEETGYISTEALPLITPFENGTPRHHTRLFSKPGLDVTIVVGELFVPPYAAEPFGNAILEYTEKEAVEEVVVLSGVPLAHAPEDHRPFYVASEDFQRTRLDGEHDIAPMPTGFLDGINGALMQRAVDSDLRTCVLTTPVHAQAPDVDASLRLLEALDAVYDLGVDTGPLEEFAAAVSRQYEELAARLETQREELAPEDRMYM
jgi:uncharacterized protein